MIYNDKSDDEGRHRGKKEKDNVGTYHSNFKSGGKNGILEPEKTGNGIKYFLYSNWCRKDWIYLPLMKTVKSKHKCL